MSGNDVLLALGPFAFYATAPSFEKLKFAADFRWEGQKRLGREPAQQFLGPGERDVHIEGVMYPEAFGGAELLTAMHAAARSGAVYPLIAMSDAGFAGQVMGLWVVKNLENTRQYFGRNGARKIDFDIHLRSYGEDGITGGLF
jgi:phage protein U